MPVPSRPLPGRRRAAAWAALGLSIAACATFAGLASRHLSRPEPENRSAPGSARHPEPRPLPPPAATGPAVLRAAPAGLRAEASAVDPQTFHVVIAAPDAARGRPSPFVVEAAPWPGAAVRRVPGGGTIRTRSASLSLSRAGVLTLRDARGGALLWQGAVRRARAGGLEMTFRHGEGQRFYGSGNAGLGLSGGLTHTGGVSGVGNGFTRIPFLWSPSGYGLLVANNTGGVSWADRAGVLRWTVPAEYVDLYLIAAPGPYALLDAYTRLTGRPPVPPAWTFGYLQSRWGYADAADVRDKWDRFRALRLPVDAFIYDYDWFTDDWRFSPKTFPDPARALAEMHRRGLHFVGIRKPRVHGANLDYARSRGWTLIGADLRFDLPEVRAWWSGQHSPLVRGGVDGWWNDEAELAYDEFFYMNAAEREGWRRATAKPFWSLNRAFAPGMQRLGAAAWTGDIPSTWGALRNQPGTMLNWGLCGMPFVGQDIGGFSGTPSPELYVRWMQEGALVPIMRAHGIQNSPRWPWAFGGPALAAARQALLLRRRLRPALLACAREAARTGAPVMRPLFFEFPDDPATYNMEREWLIGRDLLAAPVLAPGGRSEAYLPRGRWREYATGRVITGPRWIRRVVPLETIPLYVREPASQASRRPFS